MALQRHDCAVAENATHRELDGRFLPCAYPANGFVIELARILQVQLSLNPCAIGIDRAHAQMKATTDFAGRAAAADQFKDLEFTVRE